MREGKQSMLYERLCAGWCAAPELQQKFGWLPHSLRGAISQVSTKRKVKIERRRENGITSYRVANNESVQDVA